MQDKDNNWNRDLLRIWITDYRRASSPVQIRRRCVRLLPPNRTPRVQCHFRLPPSLESFLIATRERIAEILPRNGAIRYALTKQRSKNNSKAV